MKKIIKAAAVASIILSIYSLYAQASTLTRNPQLITDYNNYGGFSVLFGLVISLLIPMLLGLFSVIAITKR